MAPTHSASLDLRGTPRSDWQPRVFRAFDSLGEGACFVLVTDQDPGSHVEELQRDRETLFRWSPLEEGPAVWRVIISRRPGGISEAETVSAYLAWDHDRLDALVEAARVALAAGAREEAIRTFSEFRTGLLRHIRMEEEVLFPAFERATHFGESGPTAVMRLEHREIKRLLEQMHAGLQDPRAAAVEFTALHASLLTVLGDHNAKEEQIVYPMTDQTHSPGEREELIRRMVAP